MTDANIARFSSEILKIETYERGQCIYGSEDWSGLFVLLDGAVTEICRHEVDGQAFSVRILSNDDLFGDMFDKGIFVTYQAGEKWC